MNKLETSLLFATPWVRVSWRIQIESLTIKCDEWISYDRVPWRLEGDTSAYGFETVKGDVGKDELKECYVYVETLRLSLVFHVERNHDFKGSEGRAGQILGTSWQMG